MKHSEPCLSFTSNPHSLWYGVVQDMKHSEPCLSFTSNPHSLWYGVVQDMKHSEPCLSFTSNPHSLCGMVWYRTYLLPPTHTAFGMVWHRTHLSPPTHTACGMVWHRTGVKSSFMRQIFIFFLSCAALKVYYVKVFSQIRGLDTFCILLECATAWKIWKLSLVDG